MNKNVFVKLKTVLFKTLIPSFAITAIVLSSITPLGCRFSEEGIQMLTGDFSVPHLSEIGIPDDAHIVFDFTKPVQKVDAFVCSWEAEGSDKPEALDESTLRIPLTQEFSASRDCVTFTLEHKTKVGKKYSIEGKVTDGNGNTLAFSIPFSGYNSSIPQLVISEIRNAYSSSTDKATGSKKYKCEFVELYSLTGGNLSGVEVLSAGDGIERRYVFPSCEINAGEYIVLHLRNKEEGCIDETGDDLALSYATDSCDTARDFWAVNDKACLSNSDAVIVRNGNNNQIIDAVLFAQSSATAWPESFDQLIAAVEQSGVWVDEDGNSCALIESAFLCDGITSSAATRTISRQNMEQPSCASQWIVTANKGSGKNKESGDTPGYANSTNVYVK